MLDFYLIVTPVFGLLSLLTLLNLKFTLAEPKTKDLLKYEKIASPKQKQQQQQNKLNHATLKPGYKKTLIYLLKNFTIADLCLVKRNRNKVPFLLALSIQAILSIFITSKLIYYIPCIGFCVSLIFILLKMITYPNDHQIKNNQPLTQKKIKYEVNNGQTLEIIFTSINLLINMTVIWFQYKNTNNSQILQIICNFLLIVSSDNFIVKPLLILILSFPLCYWQFSNKFIDIDTEIVQILQGQRMLKCQYKMRNKVHNSTSNTQNTFEIEPCVNFDLNGNNLKVQKIKQKIIANSKSFKREWQIPEQNDSSLTNNLTLIFKNKESNTVPTKTSNSRKIQFEQSNIQQSLHLKGGSDVLKNSSYVRKRNKLYTQKSNFIYEKPNNFQIQNLYVQNQEQQETVDKKSFAREEGYSSAKRSLSFRKKQSQKNNNQNQNPKTNFQRHSIYHSNQKYCQKFEQQELNFSYISGFSLSGHKDLMKIRQDRHEQDLQQMDMNSPQRKKYQLRKIQIKQNEKMKISETNNDSAFKNNTKQIYKKFSLDPYSHNIQQTIEKNQLKFDQMRMQNQLKRGFQQTSENRRSMNRTSQLDLSRKSDIFSRFSNDSRMAKSVKRTKNTKDPIVRQNNENQIPSFFIQDFTC